MICRACSVKQHRMKFKLFSTECEISYTLLCVAALCVFLGIYKGLFPCVTAVMIHESGHLLAMRFLGYFPERIKVSLFEISISDTARQCRSEKSNILIIFFGPAANFICLIAFYLLYLNGKEFFLPFAVANFSVGLFNSLPVMSLDGGQLLYLFLSRFYSHGKSEKIVDIATIILIIPLAVLGFIILFNSKYNFSLLFVCVYLILSLIFKDNRYY